MFKKEYLKVFEVLKWINGILLFYSIPGLIGNLRLQQQQEILDFTLEIQEVTTNVLLEYIFILYPISITGLLLYGFQAFDKAEGHDDLFPLKSDFLVFRTLGMLTLGVPITLHAFALGVLLSLVPTPGVLAEFKGEAWLFLPLIAYWGLGTIVLSLVRRVRMVFWGLLLSPLLVPTYILVKMDEVLSKIRNMDWKKLKPRLKLEIRIKASPSPSLQLLKA